MSGRAGMVFSFRRWPGRLLVAVNVIVAMSLLSAGAVYGYVTYRLGSIRSIAAPHLSPAERNGENILLIGNQTRAGLGTSIYGSPTTLSGSLSDVIMILHLDPATGAASILSIPRDLFVPQPAGSPVGPYQKIDAALNDGRNGPDNLIEAIHDDLGIPINHYLELNFNGLQGTVDALGGIKMDFPERVYDVYSGLNVTRTGCQQLNGFQALALVRARHLQYDPPDVSPDDHAAWPYDPSSDLARIARDHTFLRVLVATAKAQGLTNPVKANAFLGSIISQITVDPGLRSQLVSLAGQYRHLNPATAPETTLPITGVGGSSGYDYHGVPIGDVDFPDQPADNQVIAAWDANALPAPSPPRQVKVTNIAGIDGLADKMASALSADHLKVTATMTGQVPASTTETLVDYHPGRLDEALAVSHDLTGAVMLETDPGTPDGTVNVQVGSTVTVASQASGPNAPGSAAAAGATGPATSSAATTVPTPGGQAPSGAADQVTSYDPRSC